MATALFVIDIQNDLATDPATRIPHASRIRSAGEQILSAARAGIEAKHNTTTISRPTTIIFVQHEEQPEDGPLVRGTEPWNLVFDPLPDAPTERLVPKSTRNYATPNPPKNPSQAKLTNPL
jgi:hypothetical protein